MSSVEEMARQVVRLSLSLESQRIPIKRDDIRKRILEGQRVFDAVFSRANQILSNVFGMEMIEVTREARQSLTQARKGVVQKPVKMYILRNALVDYKHITQRAHIDGEREYNIQIMVAVTMSKLSELSESRLIAALERLSLSSDLSMLIKHGYIERHDEMIVLGPRGQVESMDWLKEFYGDEIDAIIENTLS